VTTETDWLRAFPLRPATDAVDALRESWQILSTQYRPNFHPRCAEPALTRVLKAHVENVTARARGLLGMWSAESVINRVNFGTGKIIEERRTDIVYGWNDNKIGIQLVFEFKKLNRLASSRTHYLGEHGLLRFVTGIYAQRQAVAAMVGVLVEPFERCVPALRDALSDPKFGPALRLRHGGNAPYHRPSQLFPHAADFDTEHDRSPAMTAGNHGVIRVAHIFLSFAYAPPMKTSGPARLRVKRGSGPVPRLRRAM
jgi:hypothetical protein